MQTNHLYHGIIEVIVGPMFSGKTEELIRRLKRARLARQKIQVFKPKIDDRYHDTDVTSHDRSSFKATPVEKAEDIMKHLEPTTQVVGIDEAQFFSGDLVTLLQAIANRGVRVIAAGLDTDWRAQPFEPMPALMAIAEVVTKQTAVCLVCGAPATRTQRTLGEEGLVQVGASDCYESRCRQHFIPQVDSPTRIESESATAAEVHQ